MTPSHHIDERALAKLRWRCRRGMLENDLFIERFFSRHEDQITPARAQALTLLMDLSDNDLLDLLLGRTEPAPEIDSPDVQDVLALLRTKACSDLPTAHPPANPQGIIT